MEAKDSFPYLQEPAICSYPQVDQSTPHPFILFL